MSEFLDGLKIEAPSFIKGKVSINVGKLVAFLQENQNERGYVNAELCEGRTGLYMKLNNFQRGESGPPR